MSTVTESSGWRPVEGDKIEGTVVDIATGDGGYGPYPIVTVSTADGSEVAIHAFHQVLRGELARRRPKPGDQLRVVYLGQVTGKDGKSKYHSYRVSGGQSAGYNWDRDLPADEKADAVAGRVVYDDLAPDTSDLPQPKRDDDLPF